MVIAAWDRGGGGGLLVYFTNVANTTSADSPGNMNFLPFGQTFVDPWNFGQWNRENAEKGAVWGAVVGSFAGLLLPTCIVGGFIIGGLWEGEMPAPPPWLVGALAGGAGGLVVNIRGGPKAMVVGTVIGMVAGGIEGERAARGEIDPWARAAAGAEHGAIAGMAGGGAVALFQRAIRRPDQLAELEAQMRELRQQRPGDVNAFRAWARRVARLQRRINRLRQQRRRNP